MDTDPFVVLQSLREEFLAAAERADGYYIRLKLARKPLLLPDGSADRVILQVISEAVEDGRELALQAEWSNSPEDPECFREIVACRHGEPTPFYDRFEELASGVIRCLLQIPSAVEGFRLGDVSPEEDSLAYGSHWIEVLLQIARQQSHPVLRMSQGELTGGGSTSEVEFFQLGAYTIALRSADAGTLARMKKLARAKTSIEQLECGVLRGSAYAIDWILDRYGPAAKERADHTDAS